MLLDILQDDANHLKASKRVRTRKDWNGMRRSKKEAAVTRQRIVEAAAASFRKNAIAGTGLSCLMAAAGLTDGRS
jgi:hypothetical protein